VGEGGVSLRGNTASLRRGPPPSIPPSPETTNLENPPAPGGGCLAPTGTDCCFCSAPGTLGSFSSRASQTNQRKKKKLKK